MTMKIRKESNQRYLYVFNFDFSYENLNFCRALKATFGGKLFNFNEGQWRFNSLEVVQKIQERNPEVEIDDAINHDLKKFDLERQQKELRDKEADRLRTAKNSTISISSLKLPLYGYQKVGVEFLVNAAGRAILADQMGTGKTAQALAYVVHAKKEKTLVVCPASVKYTWANETKKWTRLKPLVIDSSTSLSLRTVHNYDVFIINYDLLNRFHDDLAYIKFDCLVADEFHYIKSPTARRSKLTRSLALKIPSVILLSGTPMLNRPVEMFNGLQIIDPKTWNDYYAYTTRYCEGHQGNWGWEAKGANNTEELHKRIHRYFLRRLKSEVLSELPPKTYIDVPVELDTETQKQYDLAEKNFIKYLRDVKKKEIKLSTFALEKIVKLGELRQLSSKGKTTSAKELVENIIDSGEKVCLFSVYNAPLEELQKHFGNKCVLLTGKTDAKERPQLIERFQKDPSVQIFLGGLVAAGAGITLTSATNVVFLDHSWVPGDHRQAEDRIHRPGQHAASVSIYQLFAKDTIDEKMKGVLEDKQALVDEIIDGLTPTSSRDAIINKIISKYEE